MDLLDSLARRVKAEVPTIDAEVEGSGLRLGRGRRSALLGTEDIGRFTVGERTERRREGRNYADLKTGEVFVDEPGLMLLLRVGRAEGRLTPQQCAVLAAVLEADEFGWLSEAVALEPGVLREELAKRVGLQLAAPSISKLRKALTGSRLLRRGRPSAARAFDAVLAEFRLDAVGRAVRLPGPQQRALEWIRERAGNARVVEGVAGVIAEGTGSVVEPVDVLVDRPVALRLEEALGGSVGADFRGPSIVVRGVSRLSLDELAPSNSPRLLSILAIADALASDVPVLRESAARLAKEWRARWK
jgi:hypothetical protein